MIADNVCLINYAYVQDGVVCYPDLVKVGVALDNGGIVRFQAAGYIMNHTQRSLKARLTAQQAQKSVSPSLTVRQVRPALIPTPGKQEKLTYEFLCSGAQDDRVLVYINADTGYEEDILIIQQSDQGVLTK
jgi:germination protein YpeB